MRNNFHGATIVAVAEIFLFAQSASISAQGEPVV
jgi:hypothetical protein